MLPWWPDVTIVQSDVTIVVPWQLSTGSKYDYLFCYCPLVGILFEVLRIVWLKINLQNSTQYLSIWCITQISHKITLCKIKSAAMNNKHPDWLFLYYINQSAHSTQNPDAIILQLWIFSTFLTYYTLSTLRTTGLEKWTKNTSYILKTCQDCQSQFVYFLFMHF